MRYYLISVADIGIYYEITKPKAGLEVRSELDYGRDTHLAITII